MFRRLLKLFLGTRGSEQNSPSKRDDDWEAEHERRQKRRAEEYSEVVKGWVFVATLNLDTPLQTLQHDGEIYRGPMDERPQHGDYSEGTWTLKTKTFEELGIDAPEFSETTRASQIGQVPADGGEFLAFLKDFRRIVESDDTVGDKIERINEVVEEKPEYQKFAAKLGDDFPEGWFASQLTEVEGIGEATAKRLFGSGFHSVEDLCTATEDELRGVPGVGSATVDAIRGYCSGAGD